MRSKAGEDRLDCIEVVGCRLIDEIVQPVLIEQIGVAAPGDARRLRVVVIREVILRHVDRQTRSFVAQIFLLQRPGVVFRVAGNEDLPPALGRERVDARLWRGCQNFQFAARLHFLAADRGVP